MRPAALVSSCALPLRCVQVASAAHLSWTVPSLNTATISAFLTVERRCAITRAVRSAISRSKACGCERVQCHKTDDTDVSRTGRVQLRLAASSVRMKQQR